MRFNPDIVVTGHTGLLIAAAPGDETDERELHRRFAKAKIRGEWFKLSDDQIQLLVAEFRETVFGKLKRFAERSHSPIGRGG